jgi:hypothetical protein
MERLMEREKLPLVPGISEPEKRFLDRVSRKYEENANAGLMRSYLIASVVILTMFSLSRWVPYWGLALIVVEAVGLALFRQYKRFASFKTRLLRKLWCQVKEASA